MLWCELVPWCVYAAGGSVPASGVPVLLSSCISLCRLMLGALPLQGARDIGTPPSMPLPPEIIGCLDLYIKLASPSSDMPSLSTVGAFLAVVGGSEEVTCSYFCNAIVMLIIFVLPSVLRAWLHSGNFRRARKALRRVLGYHSCRK